MKQLIYLSIFLSCTTAACNSQKADKVVIPKVESQSPRSTKTEKCINCDASILDLPAIKDTSKLIHDLRLKYGFEVDEHFGIHESITISKKIKLGMENQEFVLIEYDYEDGCTAAYPWKYQLLLDPNSTKLCHLGGYETIDVINLNGETVLFVTEVSGKGNGIHKILSWRTDTLINILDLDYNDVHTVDNHSDDGYFIEPLTVQFKDVNRDGFKDIVFSGKREMLMGKSSSDDIYRLDDTEHYIRAVVFVYTYDSVKQKYTALENYLKKYSALYL